jgi:hypothetical protein
VEKLLRAARGSLQRLNRLPCSSVAKKRQTFGKIQRERERAEKRQRKLEKKEEKKAAALEAAELGITVEELAARRGLGADEPAPDEELTSTP